MSCRPGALGLGAPKPVSTVISYNRMPSIGNEGFKLYAEVNNPIPFENVAMTITIPAINAEIYDIGSFGHRARSLDAAIVTP